MRLFKGIVIDTQAQFIRVSMETGFVFWTVAKPNMSIRTRIFVAWDFTKARPADIFLKQEGDIDTLTEVDTFSITDNDRPSVEIIDISLIDIFSILDDDDYDNIGLSSHQTS